MNQEKIQLGGTARSPEDVIALKKLGLQFAEVPIADRNRFSLNKERFLALKKALGIYYLCHGPREGDPNDMEGLERVYLPKVMDTLKIMPGLDMKLLTIHLWLDPRFVKREVIDYKIGFLKRVTERAKHAGITVCLENLSENAVDYAGVFEAVGGLGLTLDLGHAQLLSEKNTSFDLMERFPGRIKHVHLHDNRGGNSPEHDLHLPVGEGVIDFPEIFMKLKKIGYRRTITLELRPVEIRKCLAHVKELLRILVD